MTRNGQVLLLGLAVLGCAQAERPVPTVVNVTAAEYAFGAPDTIPAGTVTFRLRNLGQQGHIASIVRLGAGTSIASLMQGGYLLEYVHVPDALGGPATSTRDSASEVTLTLEPGRYAFFCYFHDPDGRSHAQKGMVREFQVVPGRAAAALGAPPADTIRLGDFTVQGGERMRAGRLEFLVSNDGQVGHELSIYRLADGWTLEQEKAWEDTVSTDDAGPWEDYGGVGLLAPGASIVLRGTFPPGEYRMDCGVTDPVLKKSHSDMGMLASLTLRSD